MLVGHRGLFNSISISVIFKLFLLTVALTMVSGAASSKDAPIGFVHLNVPCSCNLGDR